MRACLWRVWLWHSELEKLHEKSMKKTQKTGKPESRATAEKREKLTRVYGNCVAVYKALTGALIDEFRTWRVRGRVAVRRRESSHDRMTAHTRHAPLFCAA